MKRIAAQITTMLLLCVSSPSYAQLEDGLARGRLLYATHCVACHTAEIHWREKKLVTNWASLKFQIERWQDAAGLGWSEDDIGQVSVYLNATYYHFPLRDRINLGRGQ